MENPRNKFAEAALKHRRAQLAGEVLLLDRQAKAKREQLKHLDATLKIFDPE